jgi:uncharacterized protein
MELTRFETAQQFYERAAPFLLEREAEHCLPLGLCVDLMQNPTYYEQPPYLALVERDGAVAAAAVMTPPHNLVLSYIAAPDALALFAQDLATRSPALPGVSGRPETARAFAARWQALSGQPYQAHLSLRIYQLTAGTPVAGVPGRLRRATQADRELLIDWMRAFNREALDEDDDARVARSVDNWLSSTTRGMYLWEDRRPVAMAGAAGPTPHGIRIGAVYTPPDLRRKGYASACVAGLSQHLLGGGRSFCYLFTDLGNPTSNHIYQAIGYAPVCDVDTYTFGARE